MPAALHEWLNLIVRWAHVIAAIMWIGDSFLFMWLDSHLAQPTRPREGAVVGELWMTHAGGFYEVVKRKSLTSGELPPTLYWFKWESYSTWITGFLLLIIVYHLNGAALLIDPGVALLAPWQAIAISVLSLPVAFGLYELLWLTPLSKSQRLFGAVGFPLLIAAAYGFTRVFSARGAFLETGAVMATLMAGNVFFRIIPAQRHMLASTKADQPVDTRYGARAKARSNQNHYLTFPVLFTMLSNHFPSTYGSAQPWLTLACLILFGAGIKYLMNLRLKTPPLVWAGTAAALGGALFLGWPTSSADAARGAYAGLPKVTFEQANAILQTRCVTCHSIHPANSMFAAPPQGVTFDSPAAIAAHADRIFFRAVATKTMPLGNITGMTPEERELLGAWYAQGAEIGGSPTRPAAPAPAEPAVADKPTPPTAAPASAPSAVQPAKLEQVSPDGPSDIAVPDFAVSTSPAMVEEGRMAFAAKGCTMCHRMGENAIGPNLKGVTKRRTITWVKRMILHPEIMIQEDPVAHRLYQERLTAMTNQHVDPATLKALLAYLKSQER